MIKVIFSAVFLLLSSADSLCQNSSGSSVNTRRVADTSSAVVIGVITAIDVAAMQMTVKTDDGQLVTIIFDAKTEFLRVRPEDKGLERATPIAFTDLNVGYRVLTHNYQPPDKRQLPARQMIVITKADLAQKQERDREEWRKRGIVGVITGLDAKTKEIKLQIGSPPESEQILIVSGERTRFRRYAPDSVTFSDARASSFAELQVGDQLRALGDKNGDNSRFTPEEIVSGSFRTAGGAIIAVNMAAGEITIIDLYTRQSLTISINRNTLLRRLSPEAAEMLTSGGGRGETGTSRPNTSGSQAKKNRIDPQFLLDAAAELTLTDLKKGELVLVTSAKGASQSRVTAISVVLGLDGLLKKAQSAGAAANPGPNLGGTGLPGGIGLP